ncbi:phosphoglycolate phosphatase [Brucella sp. NBRC 12952]|uniref:Phosphoglycolate phosphatase n=1 Tax=Brucella pseudogrignonensis TaxID=419475 RepID=A0A256GE85_9HYPH|nr:HAD family hydrolase [Brucella pseudogrignonensis]EMG54575.1 phosphoglycolate phosphatase [Ochrobactrum sp. CDB2]NNV21932.1 phosphoglycolate phosphatase [Brucella pseudogrignonensis]OYR25250.1 phosphoglycolate phosphatase, bacterial [Brucella pseudogrignonensis]
MSAVNSKPIIVFDLDGTLVETAPDLLDSLNHCLAISGLRTADSESLRRFVGQGGRVMIERAFAAQQKQVDDVKLDHLVEEFREHYAAHMPGHSTFYPGVLEAMDRFSANCYTLAVCTNKFEALAVKLLTSMGEANRFAAICGADTFAYRKPDPRHLTDTIAKAGGNRDRAIMVGDSRTDIDTAKAAGIPVVAVDFGYTDLPVQHYEPSRVISHYDEFTLSMAEQLLEAVADQV